MRGLGRVWAWAQVGTPLLLGRLPPPLHCRSLVLASPRRALTSAAAGESGRAPSAWASVPRTGGPAWYSPPPGGQA
eukprot:5674656-Pyramimonas_sp.AAC.1